MTVIVPNYKTPLNYRIPDNCVNPDNSDYDFFYTTLNKSFLFKKMGDKSVTTLTIDNLGLDNLYLTPPNHKLTTL